MRRNPVVKKFFLVITGIIILMPGIVGCTSPATVVPKPASTPAPTSKPASTLKPRSPEIKSIQPDIGLADGGTEVLISGSNFSATASVTFGGIAALDVRVVSDTLVQARTPPHPSGTVDVVVTNPDGIVGTLPYGFTFIPKRVSPTPTPKLSPTPTRVPAPSPTPTSVPVPTQHTVTLSVVVMPSGRGSVSLSPPGGTYAIGTQVALTATPASGYKFVTWGGNLGGYINPVTIIMDTNKSVSAHFVSVDW